MSKRLTCDVCGEVSELVLPPPSAFSLVNCIPWSHVLGHDLCPDCTDDVWGFLKDANAALKRFANRYPNAQAPQDEKG